MNLASMINQKSRVERITEEINKTLREHMDKYTGMLNTQQTMDQIRHTFDPREFLTTVERRELDRMAIPRPGVYTFH